MFLVCTGTNHFTLLVSVVDVQVVSVSENRPVVVVGETAAFVCAGLSYTTVKPPLSFVGLGGGRGI